MNLASLLDPSLVKVPVESTTSEEVIAELVELLVRAGKVRDRESVLEALYERERKGSTGIGGGVAIPHARCEEARELMLAVGLSPEGIEFEAADDEPVYLVFLLIAPPDKPGQAVEALADIGILVQIPNLHDKLLGATSAEELLSIIKGASEQL